MRKILANTLVGLTLILQACGQTNSKAQSETIVENTYVNEVYRFSATIPDSWKLYGQNLSQKSTNSFVLNTV